MAIKPVAAWSNSYEPGIKKHYDAQAEGKPDKIEDFWARWVDENGQGLSVSAPYTGGPATSNPKAFSLSLEGLKTPVQSAKALADGWKAWYMALVFAPPPPAPPFSAILKVSASPLGVELSYAALFSGLIAEFTKVPPSAEGAFAMKAQAFGLLFYTATVTAGVSISGLSMSTPPVSLTIPMLPAL